MNLRRLAGMLALGVVGLALAAGTAQAVCPSCKDALGTSARWQAAFNASILFMMSMPFAVVAVVAGAVYRAQRRRRAGEVPGETPPAA